VGDLEDWFCVGEIPDSGERIVAGGEQEAPVGGKDGIAHAVRVGKIQRRAALSGDGHVAGFGVVGLRNRGEAGGIGGECHEGHAPREADGRQGG